MRFQYFYLAASLMLASTLQGAIMPLESAEQLEQEITNNTSPVVVKFFATWCHVCQSSALPFEEVMQETEFAGIKVIMVDADTFQSLVQKNNISGLPTFKFYAPGGQLVDTMVGVQNLDTFKDTLRKKLRSLSPDTAMAQKQHVNAEGEILAKPEEKSMPEAKGGIIAGLKNFFGAIFSGIAVIFKKIIDAIKGIFGY